MINFKCEDLKKEKIKMYHGSQDCEGNEKRGYMGGEKPLYVSFTPEGAHDYMYPIWINRVKEAQEKNEKPRSYCLYESEIDTNKLYIDPEFWDFDTIYEKEGKIHELIEKEAKKRELPPQKIQQLQRNANKIKRTGTAWDLWGTTRSKINDQDVVELCELVGADNFAQKSMSAYLLLNEKISLDKMKTIKRESK